MPLDWEMPATRQIDELATELGGAPLALAAAALLTTVANDQSRNNVGVPARAGPLRGTTSVVEFADMSVPGAVGGCI